MSDVTLDETNEGHRGTEIQAQSAFSQDYVFQGNGNGQTGPFGGVDGLRGLGSGSGSGVFGKGSIGVSAHGDNVGVSADGNIGMIVQGGETGVSVSSTGPAVNAKSTKDRGGIFQSNSDVGTMAQIRLVPSVVNAIPPQGQEGDLCAIPATQLPDQGVHLFLCVKGKDLDAEWREIQLGGKFTPGQTI